MQSIEGGTMKTGHKETPKEFYQKYGVKACLIDRIMYNLQRPVIEFVVTVVLSAATAIIMHLILRS
jgi:hypothetical protein